MSRPSPTDRSGKRSSERGLSLIELVVAMAIFALVAVLGTQALTGMIRMRDDLAARSDQAATLAEATSLLRADLAALVPMLFYPPDRAPPRSALRFARGTGRASLKLSVAGQPDFHKDVPRLTAGQTTRQTGPIGLSTQRVEWQLQAGVLSRGFWPTLTPARSASRSPSVPILTGVQDLRLRSYWPQIGWVDGASTLQASAADTATTTTAADSDSAAFAAEVYSSSLPLAVELTLISDEFGKISLVESLK
ncbi:PilD-dependent protein PddD [Phaeobacter sp. CECT 5382]|uniref:type II secretion system protein GspJ n=1 Tax=Phaeobacter sp. CECT 5382 TaxID=1712645 RepID=UPI0006DB47D6|nr:type II secretion system protein GspJ [Phaeobacter sp. CECT 5382]CUH89342.1 PilD-dependent protein PddD [Phaeobacter sp. CECT 5382]